MKDGFVKVAAASPALKLADTEYNAQRIIKCIFDAEERGVKVLVFPEMCLCGCTCGDLSLHRVVLDGAKRALEKIIAETAQTDVLAFIGLPVEFGSQVCSTAAAVCGGKLLGLVPCGSEADVIFENSCLGTLKVAVEVGEDMLALDSPAAQYALSGATVIARMAGFPQTVNSTSGTEKCISADSRRLRAGIILAAPGRGESTTDNVYSGLCIVAEDGKILAEDEACGENEDCLAVTEIDVEYLSAMRRTDPAFAAGAYESESVEWGSELSETEITRHYSRHPHLPDDPDELPAYCERVLDMQVAGLVRRMRSVGLDHCVVGISGGVDSTVAVMVASMAVRRMGLPSKNVIAVTMPCFGTSSRTKSNAVVVAEECGCEVRIIDIGNTVYSHFDDIGHAHDDYSIAYENGQARMRTMILLDIANKVNGLDVGTEDLSEYIDGWCTFNGDHISNYDVNLGLTKTQVRANVSHIAATTENSVLKAALYDVLDCPVTPELLPIHDDVIEQKSEDSVGSYSLQDFFTHKILVCGFTPAKTLRLAKLVYGEEFSEEELRRWLASWCRRLFSQQFKRSCLMDGPAIESFSVSPRNGLCMPSDAEAALFLQDLEKA